MDVIPPPLEQLIKELTKLPGIGKITATRLALYILRKPADNALSLAETLSSLHDSIQLCSTCFAFSEHDPCAICSDQRRNHRVICVVEGPGDLLAIEKTSSFHGVYHILHGVISPLEGIGPKELKIKELLERVRDTEVEEVLIATNLTVPGEATGSFLIDNLQQYPVKVTRLACGISMGMDIKYADQHTLARAIAGRQNFS
ncbi:MAG: recombination mediator RecR [Desulfobulbaceae bacterium]|nr:recombination mediator RecR [Desulfobulbaceae bacterium]